MKFDVSVNQLQKCYDVACQTLLAERNVHGHWTGELSTSALSTATAVMALEMVRRDDKAVDASHFSTLIERGLRWLADHQNDDGGWGDTTKSISNISTTMLAHASLHAAGRDEFQQSQQAARQYIDRVGGVQAVLKRYGKDRTFSVPILTHCALAGLVDWQDVIALPFELACVPARLYKTVRLSVVSYALPALIAIGQIRFHHRKPRNPITRLLRRWAQEPSLKLLERIQPVNGGFLEAAPLTSFVTMSLAGMGLSGHRVARRGVQFLVDTVRDDGSWPIDTNLATWLTTLSVNALANDLPDEDRPAIREWLLSQQYRQTHPYTAQHREDGHGPTCPAGFPMPTIPPVPS